MSGGESEPEIVPVCVTRQRSEISMPGTTPARGFWRYMGSGNLSGPNNMPGKVWVQWVPITYVPEQRP